MSEGLPPTTSDVPRTGPARQGMKPAAPARLCAFSTVGTTPRNAPKMMKHTTPSACTTDHGPSRENLRSGGAGRPRAATKSQASEPLTLLG